VATIRKKGLTGVESCGAHWLVAEEEIQRNVKDSTTPFETEKKKRVK